jgi:hypothetical protein
VVSALPDTEKFIRAVFSPCYRDAKLRLKSQGSFCPNGRISERFEVINSFFWAACASDSTPDNIPGGPDPA